MPAHPVKQAAVKKKKKNPTEKLGRARADLILLEVAVFVFVFCSRLLSSHLGLSSKHAEILQVAGQDDKSAATWPARS